MTGGVTRPVTRPVTGGVTRPRVYAAHPMTCYATGHAARCLAGLRRLAPGVDLIDPEAAGWVSDAEWLTGWPPMLAGLDALVVFADPAGTVGVGCLREIADALAVGLGVAAYSARRGCLVELRGLSFVCPPTPRRLARLRTGAPVELGVVLGGVLGVSRSVGVPAGGPGGTSGMSGVNGPAGNAGCAPPAGRAATPRGAPPRLPAKRRSTEGKTPETPTERGSPMTGGEAGR